MWHDVVDLNAFYASPRGLVARRMIRRRIRAMWPDVRGQSVLGLGYAPPFLGPFVAEATRIVALMPPAQGVMAWPAQGRRRVVLADECEIPVADRTFDRVLLVHAVECSEHLRPMLREVWRVLADGGRLLVVAPNRRGLWARFERTPFGYGHPFTPRQLSRLLRKSLFSPLRAETALYVPPVGSRLLLRSAGAWERLGERWGLPFAGVVVVEAAKQVYAVDPTRAAVRRRRAYGRLLGRPAPS